MNIFSKLFGKSEVKSGAVGLWNILPPIQKAIFLNMKADDGIDVFKKLWVAYKATMMVGDAVSSLPVRVQDSKGDKVSGDAIKNKAVQSFLYNPNPLDSNSELIKQLVNYLVMDGAGYIHKTDSVLGNNDYWVLMSQNIKPIAGGIDEPVIKRYDSHTGTGIIHYPPESIIHVRDFNPENRIIGMSRISAGVSEVEFAEQMGNYKNSLYANKATIPGALSTDGSLTDEQFARLKKQFNEEHAGTDNAGKNLILEAGLKYTPMAFSPTDLGIIQSESMTESKISSLIGVPPELLNLTDQKNYANYSEARKGFYIETVLPTGKQVWSILNRYFFPDGNYKFIIDKTEIDVLRPDAAELNTSWWMTPNQKRAAAGLEKMDDPAMDKVYIPSTMVDIDMLGMEDNNNL